MTPLDYALAALLILWRSLVRFVDTTVTRVRMRLVAEKWGTWHEDPRPRGVLNIRFVREDWPRRERTRARARAETR